MAINSLSASSYGMSGLVSGMDTQQMVEKMLAGTQNKISKATQKKTVLQYKQQMYRDVSAKLTALQSSYLSFTSKTNLLSNAFYNTMNTTITPPTGKSAAFSVTGSSTAKAGTVTMDYIKQLATARSARTQEDASGAVQGVMSQSVAKELLSGYTSADAVMRIEVGDKSVSFADVAVLFGGKTQSEVASIINDKLQGIGAEARFVNNKLQIIASNSDDYITITGNKNVTNSSFGTKMFGVAQLSGKGTISASIDTSAYLPGFEVNLDGRQQTIKLDVDALRNYAEATTPAELDAARTALVKGLNDQMKHYFGTGASVTLDNSNGTLTFGTGTKSQKITITGTTGVMGTMGLTSGISNKLNTTMKLKDLNFATQLQGNQHTFSINGVEFSYSADATLSSIISDINSSKAGVKVSYLESEDRFVIASNETGAGTVDFTAPGAIKQTEGNLMSVLFGLGGSGSVQGKGVSIDMTAAAAVTSADIKDGGTFTFNVNGSDYKFKVSHTQAQGSFTVESFAEKMNSSFKSTFGTLPDGTQKVEFLNDNGTYTIRVNDSQTVVKAVKTDSTTNTNSLGFTAGQSTVASSKDTTLEQAGIHFGTGSSMTINVGTFTDANGTAAACSVTLTAAELNGATTLEDLTNLINDKIEAQYTEASHKSAVPKLSFDETSGAFKLMGVDIPMEIVINQNDTDSNDPSTNLKNIFGQMSMSVNAPASANGLQETSAGQNAVFSINGSEMERASNTFTVEGLTYTLFDVTGKLKAGAVADADGKYAHTDYEFDAATKIAVTRNTDQIVEGIQEFLKMYNETIDYITGLFKSDATYKDYAPLTAAQKAEMSDREVELWEEKAKEGLLRNDAHLERVLSSLRTAMYTKPEGSSIAIYDLGITTSFYTNEGNFNADSLDDLRSAIESDPDAVRQLFAGTGGIMDLVNTAINNATKNSYASPGYLTAVAGSNLLDTSSTIYKQIKEIDTQLVTLENRYQSEYNRYWKQFNAMEQLISQMNSQSSWLSQQFS